MVEGFEEPGTGQSRFTGFRWENHYRLFRQDVPLNPMLYAEYEEPANTRSNQDIMAKPG